MEREREIEREREKEGERERELYEWLLYAPQSFSINEIAIIKYNRFMITIIAKKKINY